MVMGMIVGAVFMGFVIMVVVMVVPVRVAMTSEDKESQQVREQASGANNENELGVIDFGGFHKASQSFEYDGDTKGDEEDCVEKSTENLCSYPLRKFVSQRCVDVERESQRNLRQR